MILYHTDKYKRYRGKQSQARKNNNYNQDTYDIADKYLYNPRTESIIEPLETEKNEACQLINNKWLIVTDRLGQYYYEQDGLKVEIIELGVGIPNGCIQDAPPSKYHTTHDGTDWIEDIIAKQNQISQDLEDALDMYIDSIAQTKNYDSRITCSLRAAYPNPWQQEGVTFGQWMDGCYVKAFAILAEVKEGVRPIPTVEEMIAEMPIIEWPDITL